MCEHIFSPLCPLYSTTQPQEEEGPEAVEPPDASGRDALDHPEKETLHFQMSFPLRL